MKNMMKFLVLMAAAVSAFGQATTTQTTLSTSITASGQSNTVCIASATGVVIPSATTNGSYLGIDQEAVRVTATAPGNTNCYRVTRGQLGTAVAGHNSGSTVWVGNAATNSGDSSRPFNGAFVATVPSGACTASQQYTLPVIVYGNALGMSNGDVYTCSSNGLWGQPKSFYVSPSACTFAPTTLTTTNSYTYVGASNLFVLNGTTNAATGTLTLTCDIRVPSLVNTSSPAVLQDITLFVGSQTTAPSALGTATLGSISFPSAATSETASTVTPVTVGGTVSTTSPTAITSTTTAGSFLTVKHTYSSAVNLANDLQVLRYTLPFTNGSAAAMTVNTPGLIVHYIQEQ